LRATIVGDLPPGETWSFDAYMALRQAVGALARSMGWRQWVYVDLATPEEPSAADTDGDPDTNQKIDAMLTEDAEQDHDT